VDNCPWTSNPGQTDLDTDGIGDACDAGIWYRAGWLMRRSIPINNTCGEIVYGHQVMISLDASNFDFSNAEPDGSDIRVTDSDGLTPIPYWIEEWDAVGEQAVIWVKVPSIPLEGMVIYLYYNNASSPGPELIYAPPTGPWDKHADNPIIPAGHPNGGDSLLAENMVYDDDTGHYWLVFADYGLGGIGLAWSDDPGDPTSWTTESELNASGNAPHLMEEGGTWYLFYADIPNIMVATASAVTGSYTIEATPVLTVTEQWETYRVDEPYVFWCDTLSKWVLLYMGDERFGGQPWEQIGYATADSLTGPYTKHASNPVIPFGPSGSIDAGTVADPWVVEVNGTYYIGYTVSPTTHHPWQTSYVTTTDWQTFTKSNEIILGLGGADDWDEDKAFRGAVTRFGDTYYFPYTGATASPYVYRMGLATQSVYMLESLNDPNQVFNFYEPFDGTELDTDVWTTNLYGSGGTAIVSGGLITLTGQSSGSSGYIEILASPTIATGTLLETYSRHQDAGLNAGENGSYPDETNTAGEIGYKGSSWSNVIRIMDYPDMQVYTIHSNNGGTSSGYIDTQVDFDTAWHTFRIHRSITGTVAFQVDDNPYEVIASTYVPTSGIRPWLLSYARTPAPQGRLEVDWVRVRNYCGVEAFFAVGEEDNYDGGPTNVTLIDLNASTTQKSWLPIVFAGCIIVFVGLWLLVVHTWRPTETNRMD